MRTYLRIAGGGFAAGLLGLLTCVLTVFVALAVFGLSFTLVDELAQVQASGVELEQSVWALLCQSFVASAANGGRGLWELRGTFLIFGGLGLLAAWLLEGARWVTPTRASTVGFFSVAVLFIIATIAWVYVQHEEVALWMAESPETYRWKAVLLDSQVAALTVAPIFALALAYPLWSLWHWWYLRLGGQVQGAATGQDPVAQRTTRDDDHRSYSNRLAALKRGNAEAATGETATTGDTTTPRVWVSNRHLALLALFAFVSLVGFAVARQYHAQVALRLQHGTTFVDATTQPSAEFHLAIASDVKRLRIVNIKGLGEVDVTLTPVGDAARPVGEIAAWTFAWRADDYLYQELPVQQLAAGDYLLRFEQRRGWGYFEYMLSQGGGRTSQSLALATGILLALGVMSAVVGVGLAVARRL